MDDSDPNIVKRLNGLPPYLDADGNVTDTPPVATESPVEDAPQETQEEDPKEDSSEEPQEPQEETQEENVEDVAVEDKPDEPTEEDALKNSKNPERTKKYIDKLKKQNEELKRKNVLDNINPEPIPNQWPESPTTNEIPSASLFPGLTQKQVDTAFSEIMDENGYVDRGLLNSTMYNLQKENAELKKRLDEEARERKRIEQRQDQQERNEIMREVHGKFPQIDPQNKEKFDDRVWQYVTKNMAAEMLNEAERAARTGEVIDPNDKNLQRQRIQRLADKATKLLEQDLLDDNGEVDPTRLMNKKDKAKLTEAENAKRNINAIGTSQSSQRYSYSDQDTLVKATLRGEPGALAERLRRAGQ